MWRRSPSVGSTRLATRIRVVCFSYFTVSIDEDICDRTVTPPRTRHASGYLNVTYISTSRLSSTSLYKTDVMQEKTLEVEDYGGGYSANHDACDVLFSYTS
jgi:hypothetical protein